MVRDTTRHFGESEGVSVPVLEPEHVDAEIPAEEDAKVASCVERALEHLFLVSTEATPGERPSDFAITPA